MIQTTYKYEVGDILSVVFGDNRSVVRIERRDESFYYLIYLFFPDGTKNDDEGPLIFPWSIESIEGGKFWSLDPTYVRERLLNGRNKHVLPTKKDK